MQLKQAVEDMLRELATVDYSMLEDIPMRIIEKANKLGWIDKAASGEYYITNVGREILSIHDKPMEDC